MVKWMGALLALLAVIGLVAVSESLSCAEVQYSGGTLVHCRSMSIFQPSDHVGDADSDAGALASIPPPPWLIGLLGAAYHGGCQTTEVPEGQWTVCRDGFSMLERNGTIAAWVLGLHPGEDRIRNANAADEPEDLARERQEIERDLEQARSRNTELQERLREMEAYEAQLERAESLARVHPDSMTQAHPER